MKTPLLPLSAALVSLIPAAVLARGVTPYLPLNLEPEIESQVERVLILGGQPVLTRPIPAALVLEALPRACDIDHALCKRVQRYLARFTHDSGITHASVGGAAASGSNPTLPDLYGMHDHSAWSASGQAFLQPSAYLLLDAGAVAYAGKVDFTGTMLSFGAGFAQLDVGYRPHWLSPMTDSSMLMSTEAPTMPSVTLSNYAPLTRLGIRYELFDARMSTSEHILVQNRLVSGNPRLAGIHLSMEPVSGWSLGVNRLLQYGGASRPASLSNLFNAFFNPSRYDNTNANLSVDQQFGNQQASITSSFLHTGRVPFVFYTEYAGEDTSRGKGYLLGNSALSVGIHFPRLWERFDLTFETSEWQNAWYVHNVYQDGMTNDFRVVGNWFGDQRVFNDAIGGRSGMVRLAWDATFGGLLEVRYRTLQNQDYGPFQYHSLQQATLGYSRPWHGMVVGGEIDAGRDVFGAGFGRLAGFVRYNDHSGGLSPSLREAGDEGGSAYSGDQGNRNELFVEAGGNLNRVNFDFTSATTRFNGPQEYGYHFGAGALRHVSLHSDLGARIEVDGVDGHSLLGIRAVDYRYRFRSPLALGFYLGAARYDLVTPAYGIYYGIGAQWRGILPGWDLGADLKYANSVARDHLLLSDPPNVGGRTDSFYNITIATLSISRRF